MLEVKLGAASEERPVDLQPHLLQRNLLERELLRPGVLVVADAVLDPGALPVATLDHGGVGVGLVGEDSLERGQRFRPSSVARR
jgi:hypothetical protein